MMQKIVSKENQKIKELISIKNNINKSLLFLEGKRLVFDTPKNLIEKIFINEKNFSEYSNIINTYDNENVYIISDSIFQKIKDTNNSQGIVATAHFDFKKNITQCDLSKINLILILDCIQDPGNLGTIIRMSEAAGVDLLLISQDSCSLFNTKVIRSSMSSIFRLNICISDDLLKEMNCLKNNNFRLAATSLTNNSIVYTNYNFKQKVAIIVGNEGNGIKKSIIKFSDDMIRIPMEGNIESLNVAIATSIICYEHLRQNNEIR